MRVAQLMTAEPDVVTIEAGATLVRAAGHLIRHRIGALPVVDRDAVPIGLVAERDIARALQENPDGAAALTVQRVMRAPAPRCDIDDEIRGVMTRMTRERLRHLVVCEGPQLAGVISVGDILKHRLAELELETGVLRDYVAARRGAI